MSSSSDLLQALQPPGSVGRRASVLPPRTVARPDLLDLGSMPLAASVIDDETPIVDVVEPSSFDAVDAGHDAGYEAGLAEGRAVAEAEIAGERAELMHAGVAAEQLVVALGAAVEEARRQRAVALDGLATELAEAALAMAEAVIGREPIIPVDALTRALALVPGRVEVRARMHPEDLVDLPDVPSVTFVGDATIERGGCVLDLPDATIDGQLGPALERVRDALFDRTEVAW